MTKKRPTKAEIEAELAKIDLLPAKEIAERTDAILRGMLNSPPQPHAPKPAKKKAKRAK